AGVLGAVAALNLGFYFFDYAPTRVYGNPTAEISDVLCDVLETRADVPPVYFDGAPYMYWDFGATAFRLRHLEGRDIAPGQETEPISVEEGALFVVLELKMDDFGWLLTHYPGGVTEHYTSDEDGRLLFVLYEVPSWRE
ncbi:MAG: hypothetical protein JXD18_08015, partial [Anaerolineae bacterium]|nr:hypothetical protein [Anaerolineae bacterium]